MKKKHFNEKYPPPPPPPGIRLFVFFGLSVIFRSVGRLFVVLLFDVVFFPQKNIFMGFLYNIYILANTLIEYQGVSKVTSKFVNELGGEYIISKTTHK